MPIRHLYYRPDTAPHDAPGRGPGADPDAGHAEPLRSDAACFFERIAPQRPVRPSFEHIPDHGFLVEDARSRMICTGRASLDRPGLSCDAEVVGARGDALLPPRAAEGYHVFVRVRQTLRAPGASGSSGSRGRSAAAR